MDSNISELGHDDAANTLAYLIWKNELLEEEQLEDALSTWRSSSSKTDFAEHLKKQVAAGDSIVQAAVSVANAKLESAADELKSEVTLWSSRRSLAPTSEQSNTEREASLKTSRGQKPNGSKSDARQVSNEGFTSFIFR